MWKRGKKGKKKKKREINLSLMPDNCLWTPKLTHGCDEDRVVCFGAVDHRQPPPHTFTTISLCPSALLSSIIPRDFCIIVIFCSVPFLLPLRPTHPTNPTSLSQLHSFPRFLHLTSIHHKHTRTHTSISPSFPHFPVPPLPNTLQCIPACSLLPCLPSFLPLHPSAQSTKSLWEGDCCLALLSNPTQLTIFALTLSSCPPPKYEKHPQKCLHPPHTTLQARRRPQTQTT